MKVYSTFPRIPHLKGSSFDDGDLVLDAKATQDWLQARVRVFEKLDGLNVTFVCRGRGRHVHYALKPLWNDALDGAVKRAIEIWVLQHEETLANALEDGSHLYGEWLWHTISVPYASLPAPLLGISFRDAKGRLLSFDVASERIAAAGVVPTQPIFEGVLQTLKTVERLSRHSALGAQNTEGLILERVEGRFLDEERAWAKWVRPDYRHPRVESLSGQKNRVEG